MGWLDWVGVVIRGLEKMIHSCMFGIFVPRVHADEEMENSSWKEWGDKRQLILSHLAAGPSKGANMCNVLEPAGTLWL